MEDANSHRLHLLSMIVGVLLVLAGAGMIVVSIFVNSLLGQINRLEEQETLTPEEIQLILAETDPIEVTEIAATETVPEETEETTEPPATETVTEATEEIPEESETEPAEHTVVNILLVGQDRRIDQPRQRSDSMILCSINTEKMTIVLTSFLRDTYVDLPGSYGMNKLNATYAIGGFPMLNQCLLENFGVHVDYNIEVDFTGFKKVLDTLGGIDMELTAKEAEIVEGDQVVGMNHLDGGQALMYARIRKIDDDFERTNRQRKVLVAVYDNVKQMSLREMFELCNAVLPLITTDMTNEVITEYIFTLFPRRNDFEIITQSVPDRSEFEYDMIDGLSVVVPKLNRIRKKLAETIG